MKASARARGQADSAARCSGEECGKGLGAGGGAKRLVNAFEWALEWACEGAPGVVNMPERSAGVAVLGASRLFTRPMSSCG